MCGVLAIELNFHDALSEFLKDALSEFLKPMDTLLTHIFYIYSNSSKKHTVLKIFCQELKGQYEMYGSGVKPLKVGGTRWIDHKLQAIRKLLEKLGLYVGHFKDSTSSAKNSAALATMQGKLKKLVDARILLLSAFFNDILTEAKKFSLLT